MRRDPDFNLSECRENLLAPTINEAILDIFDVKYKTEFTPKRIRKISERFSGCLREEYVSSGVSYVRRWDYESLMKRQVPPAKKKAGRPACQYINRQAGICLQYFQNIDWNLQTEKYIL